MASPMQTIYDIGDDAFQSLFLLKIIETGTNNSFNDISYRITDVTIPATGRTEYEVPFMSMKFTRAGGKIENENQFTIAFRVDREWALYTALRNWKQTFTDEESGQISGTYGKVNNIEVYALAPGAIGADGGITTTGNIKQKWIFNKAYIKELGSIDFSYEAEDAVIVEAIFEFGWLSDLD
jgi:hypothetical protein